MWSGNQNKIPKGWLLCNGENGTPNLKDRFIVSCGDTGDSWLIAGKVMIG